MGQLPPARLLRVDIQIKLAGIEKQRAVQVNPSALQSSILPESMGGKGEAPVNKICISIRTLTFRGYSVDHKGPSVANSL